jgi:hypothetical protein
MKPAEKNSIAFTIFLHHDSCRNIAKHSSMVSLWPNTGPTVSLINVPCTHLCLSWYTENCAMYILACLHTPKIVTMCTFMTAVHVIECTYVHKILADILRFQKCHVCHIFYIKKIFLEEKWCKFLRKTGTPCWSRLIVGWSTLCK